MDKALVNFFLRELEHVKAQTYDVQYPEIEYSQFFPVDNQAHEGAENITYHSFDRRGLAKITADYGDDVPRVDVFGKEFIRPVRGITSGYGYSVQEIRAAMKAGRPLEQRKADASREAIEQKIDRIAFDGDEKFGLFGLFNQPNITIEDVADSGVGDSTNWDDKTPEQILEDMNGLVNSQFADTKMIERPDTMLLPPLKYTKVAMTRMADGTDTTILEFFLKNQTMVTRVLPSNRIQGKGAGGADVMVVYRADPRKVTVDIPVEFEQFEPERKGLKYEVDCHARCGGMIAYYPLSISIGVGI